MKTLLIITPGLTQVTDAVFNLVVAETGEGLASHLCSSYLYAFRDLYERPERIEEWTKRFGEMEVKFIDDTDITEDELIEKNIKWYESLKEVTNLEFENKKLSSIDWLVKELEDFGDSHQCEITWKELDELIKQAKVMHKAEIEKAFIIGATSVLAPKEIKLEKYYDENFNQ